MNDLTHPEVIQVAIKAYWQDEKTFVEILRVFPQIDYIIQTYTFDGDSLTVDVSSSIGGYAFQMKGELMDIKEKP